MDKVGLERFSSEGPDSGRTHLRADLCCRADGWGSLDRDPVDPCSFCSWCGICLQHPDEPCDGPAGSRQAGTGANRTA